MSIPSDDPTLAVPPTAPEQPGAVEAPRLGPPAPADQAPVLPLSTWEDLAREHLARALQAGVPTVRRWTCAVAPDRRFLLFILDTATGPVVLAFDHAHAAGLRDDLRMYLVELQRDPAPGPVAS